ncbi:unnamed protein product [Calypogeia fissa]
MADPPVTSATDANVAQLSLELQCKLKVEPDEEATQSPQPEESFSALTAALEDMSWASWQNAKEMMEEMIKELQSKIRSLEKELGLYKENAAQAEKKSAESKELPQQPGSMDVSNPPRKNQEQLQQPIREPSKENAAAAAREMQVLQKQRGKVLEGLKQLLGSLSDSYYLRTNTSRVEQAKREVNTLIGIITGRNVQGSNNYVSDRSNVHLGQLQHTIEVQKSDLQNSRAREKEWTTLVHNLEDDNRRLQKNISDLQVEHRKIQTASRSYPANSATPTHVISAFGKLTVTVRSFNTQLLKCIPDGTKGELFSAYEDVTFHRPYQKPSEILRAEVQSILFESFENESFSQGGHSVHIDPLKRKRAFFSMYEDFQNQMIQWDPDYDSKDHHGQEVDPFFAAYHNRTKTRVWQTFGVSLSPGKELKNLEGAFKKAVQNVWILHLLSFAFEPRASLFRVPRKAAFEPEYMETLASLEIDAPVEEVAFMITPGLIIDKFQVHRSEIYPVLSVRQ